MPKKTVIIGLGDSAQSGKDVIAEYLVENYGFTKFAFAEHLRNALYTLNPIVEFHHEYYRLQSIVDEFGWEKSKKDAPEVRRLLQILGTDVCRNTFGEDCWINLVAKDIAGCDKVVLGDYRFINEAKFIHSTDYDIKLVCKVLRPDADQVRPHSSEGGVPTEFTDMEVRNDGNLSKLYGRIDKLAQDYKF